MMKLGLWHRGLRGLRAIGLLSLCAMVLVGCGGSPKKSSTPSKGSDTYPPSKLSAIPDAKPRAEPRSRYGNPKSYVVLGKRYHTLPTSAGFVERGHASWYGRKFHGRRTSSGEKYNMYAMTAAHKRLPLPSYVQVTNLSNGKRVVVKVNDRGPFHGNRVIDLSYTAAHKLDLVKHGTAMVEVRAIDPKTKRPYGKTRPETRVVSAKPLGDAKRTAKAPSSEPIVRVKPASAKVAKTGAKPTPTPEAEPSVAAAVAGEDRLVDAEPLLADAAPARPKDLEPTTSGPDQDLFVQAGAFGDRGNAERLRKRLDSQLSTGVRVLPTASGGKRTWYRVQVGPLRSNDEAGQVSRKLSDLGVASPHVVRL